MAKFKAVIRLMPRQSIHNPEANTILDALHSLGFTMVEKIRMGTQTSLIFQAKNKKEAADLTKKLAEKLYNPVMQDYKIVSITKAG